MKIKVEYLHASRHKHGETVAAAFQRQMSAKGADVDVHHVREMEPSELPTADLYLFSSPGRFGRPIRDMRRFLKKVELPAGTRYAVLTTEAAPKPDKNTGRLPTEEELVAQHQRVRPFMNEILQSKDLVKVGEEKVYVKGLNGPLEDGWETKVGAFAGALCSSLGVDGSSTRIPGEPA